MKETHLVPKHVITCPVYYEEMVERLANKPRGHERNPFSPKTRHYLPSLLCGKLFTRVGITRIQTPAPSLAATCNTCKIQFHVMARSLHKGGDKTMGIFC
uniref:Uncharacterized protein n=1 Tax=Cacopsylla melanoneura TaxID=428564 RepID=A0A8D8LNN8_9HEMI